MSTPTVTVERHVVTVTTDGNVTVVGNVTSAASAAQNAAAAAASEAAAGASETTASAAAVTATTQAGISTTQAGISTTQAGIATAAAATATTQAGLASGYATNAQSYMVSAQGYRDEAQTAAGTATTQAGLASGYAAAASASAAAAAAAVASGVAAGTLPASFTTLAASGQATFSAVGDSSNSTVLLANATQNLLALYASGASADQKRWGWQSGSAVGDGVIRLRALNDAMTNGLNAISISRSGIASVALTLGGGTVINGTLASSSAAITGALSVTGNVTMGGASSAYLLDVRYGQCLAGADAGGFYFASGLASNAVAVYIGNAATTELRHSAAVGGVVTHFLGGAQRFSIYADRIAIASTAKIYLDGVTGSGDTYLVESSANVMDMYAGGVNALSVRSTGLRIAGGGTFAKVAANCGQVEYDAGNGYLNISATSNTGYGAIDFYGTNAGTSTWIARMNYDGSTTFQGDVRVPTKTPASASAAGTVGTLAWDASYLYACTAANTWKRAALTTW